MKIIINPSAYGTRKAYAKNNPKSDPKSYGESGPKRTAKSDSKTTSESYNSQTRTWTANSAKSSHQPKVLFKGILIL